MPKLGGAQRRSNNILVLCKVLLRQNWGRGGDCSVDGCWILQPKPRRERARVRPAEGYHFGSCAVLLEDIVPYKVVSICQRLPRGEVLQMVCGEVFERLRVAVEPMPAMHTVHCHGRGVLVSAHTATTRGTYSRVQRFNLNSEGVGKGGGSLDPSYVLITDLIFISYIISSDGTVCEFLNVDHSYSSWIMIMPASMVWWRRWWRRRQVEYR